MGEKKLFLKIASFKIIFILKAFVFTSFGSL